MSFYKLHRNWFSKTSVMWWYHEIGFLFITSIWASKTNCWLLKCVSGLLRWLSGLLRRVSGLLRRLSGLLRRLIWMCFSSALKSHLIVKFGRVKLYYELLVLKHIFICMYLNENSFAGFHKLFKWFSAYKMNCLFFHTQKFFDTIAHGTSFLWIRKTKSKLFSN